MNMNTTDPQVARPGTAAPQADSQLLLLELVRELKGYRESLDASQTQAAAERKSERRHRSILQGLLFGAPLILGLLYFAFFFSSSTGFRWGPWGQVVGVVRIDGPIGSNEKASAANIIPSLQKAFENPQVKAVVLHIDSGGGAPVEAERIYTAIESLKKKHPKEVVAVVNNIGASAAYMIAVHADKIVAARYAFVGSIGAIMAPWRLDKAIAKVDVSQRVYASGKLKSFLNPYTPVSPEVDAKAQHLVDYFGTVFLNDVKEKRGKALKPGVDYGSGEVWSGIEAKELGLVDQLGTLEEYVGSTWSGVKTYDFGPSNDSYQLFARALQEAANNAMERMTFTVPTIH